MKEKYWEQFMMTGRVDDYLCYKGFSICTQVMEQYEKIAPKDCRSLAESKGQGSESDNSYRDGVILRSYR